MARVIVDTSFLSCLVKTGLLDQTLDMIGESKMFIWLHTKIIKK